MNCSKMLSYFVLCAMFALSGAFLDTVTSDANQLHATILQMITQEQSLRLHLETQVHDQQKQITNLTDQINKDRRQVAFSGRVGVQLSASGLGIVKMHNIITNIGNAYDSSTGKFHCPVSGLYLVSCTIISDIGHDIWIKVYQNRDIIARPFTGAIANDHASGTDSVVVHANAGDAIFLNDLGGLSAYVDSQSTFIAVLLVAD